LQQEEKKDGKDMEQVKPPWGERKRKCADIC
jgi:hypothetical protein